MTYLSLPRFISGKLYSFLEDLLPSDTPAFLEAPKEYTPVRPADAINFRRNSSVGIYKTPEGKKVVIKQYHYRFQTLDYEFLHNELAMLRLFQRVRKKRADTEFPMLHQSADTGNTIMIVTDYATGKPLHLLPAKIMKESLVRAISYIRKSSADIAKRHPEIPRRTRFITVALYPIYWLRAVLKEPQIRPTAFRAFTEFYTYAIPSFPKRIPESLVHRDLLSDNVLYDGRTRKVTILDPECMVLMDDLYDLALLPRLYVRHLFPKDIIEIFRAFSLTSFEKNRLIYLMLVGCLVKIATEPKGARDYDDAVRGLMNVIRVYIPEFQKEIA